MVIDKSASTEELKALKKTLLEEHKGLLDFNKLEYSGQGQIRRIHFSVDCQDGFSGTAGSGYYFSIIRYSTFIGIIKIRLLLPLVSEDQIRRSGRIFLKNRTASVG